MLHIAISTAFSRDKQDRRWKFECCKISINYNHDSVQANETSSGEEEENTGSIESISDNRVLLIIAPVSAGLCILCTIFCACMYRRENRRQSLHKYSSEAQGRNTDEMRMMEMRDIPNPMIIDAGTVNATYTHS